MATCIRTAVRETREGPMNEQGSRPSAWDGTGWMPLIIGIMALASVARLVVVGELPPLAPAWLAGLAPIIFASMIWVMESRPSRLTGVHYSVRHRPRGLPWHHHLS